MSVLRGVQSMYPSPPLCYINLDTVSPLIGGKPLPAMPYKASIGLFMACCMPLLQQHHPTAGHKKTCASRDHPQRHLRGLKEPQVLALPLNQRSQS